jgi:sortase A
MIPTRVLTGASLALLITGVATFGVATVQIRGAEASVRSTTSPPLAPLSQARIPVAAYPAIAANTATRLGSPRLGARIGSIWLPSLEERWTIIEGTRRADLRRGVGHVASTALPGATSNSVLAGHRETVFSRLGELSLGDRVVVRTNAGRFTYAVVRTRIVKADAIGVLAATSTSRLTMITCYPFRNYGPSPQRYVVIAKLVAALPSVADGS